MNLMPQTNVDASYAVYHFRTQYCTEVEVDLHHSEQIILFRDKSDAISFLDSVDKADFRALSALHPELGLPETDNVLVKHPGVYKMKVFTQEYPLPLCVVLHKEYQNHPDYGKYIGWAYWKLD